MNKPTQRLPDWMVRLDELVHQLLCRPFEWGVTDCCTVASDVVLAVTGVDPMSDFRGRYRSERNALKLLARSGGIEALLTSRLGPLVPLACAQVGDIGLCSDGRLVFCGGGGAWKGPGDQGLVTTSEPEKVWRCHV